MYRHALVLCHCLYPCYVVCIVMLFCSDHKLGVTGMVHVIDDFLLLAHSVENCNHDLMALLLFANKLGSHWQW